ncbi:MAG: hypothetical protein AABY45_03320 [Deltaproteobacteria bacterium]
MKKCLFLILFIISSIVMTGSIHSYAEDSTIGKDAKKAAKEIKEAAQQTGRAVKSAVKDPKVRKAGADAKEAAKETGGVIKKEVKEALK